MLKAVIVDDEPLARDELAYLLKRTKQVEIVGEADSINSALEKIKVFEVNIIFLDIQLSDESGLDLAQRLLEIDNRPEIVFATAYDEYALKAFDLHAIDYLLKPFDEKRVQKTIEKISKRLERKEPNSLFMHQKNQRVEMTDKLAITVDDRIVLIHSKNILYLYSLKGKTVIVTNDQTYQVAELLVTFERKLSHSPIMRIHRAYLVNVNEIVEIQPWFNSTYNLIMKDGEKVPVSRTYTKELKQLLNF